MMYRVLIALLLALAGCASAPSSDPVPQLPVQSSSVSSTSASQSPAQSVQATPANSATPSRVSMPTSSSASPQAIQFAGRLTFPPSNDWEKAPGADRPLMTIEFSEGGKRAHEGRPVLMLYTEEFETWVQQFEGGVFKAYGPCGVTLPSTYTQPVRYTEGDITTAGGRVGQYYRSKSCDPQSQSVRHTWIFDYTDGNGTKRGLMIHGLPAPHSVSDFPYGKAVKYISDATW